MKTTSVPSPISLNVILLTLLFTAVVYIGVTGKRVPLLSNVRTDIILLVLSGLRWLDVSLYPNRPAGTARNCYTGRV